MEYEGYSGNVKSNQSTNRQNKAKILSLIRNSRGISRAEIAKQSGVSPPTVTRIVDDLIHEYQLVREVGTGTSNGGRPPRMVEFNAETNYVIGIDWGRTHIYATLSSLNADNLYEIDSPIHSQQDFDWDLQTIYSVIENLLTRSGVDRSKLLGIGIAAAGYINKKGIIEYSPNFSWKNVNLHQPLIDKFQKPVIVGNVSQVMAMSELYYGRHELKDFVFISIGYGLGSGIIINGKPLRGYNGITGELGHTRVNPGQYKKRKCVCGKYNCLECFVSGRGIRQTAMEGIRNHPNSLIHELSDGRPEKITARLVAEAARRGDAFAREIMLDVAEILGIAAANMTNVLNVQAIILGGKVADAGDFFLKRIRQVFNKEQLRNTTHPARIIKTSISKNTAGKGAVALILREVLNLRIFENKYLKSPSEFVANR